MKDVHLLPHILPNVFSIAKSLTPAQFSSLVLPSLKPLFIIKDPPQNMLTLLDNLPTLQSKTEKNVFRERGSAKLEMLGYLSYFLQRYYHSFTMH